MSLSPAFLDELRRRTTLSALIGRSVKVTRAGREHKACCPFHNEKTPSFTINDARGFYHCFGCGAHGDAIGWLIAHRGLAFIDAVKELAGEAGLEVPAPSPAAARASAERQSQRDILEAAAALYARLLHADDAAPVRAWLAQRNIDAAQAEAWQLGFAPAEIDLPRALGQPVPALIEAGLMAPAEGEPAGSRVAGPRLRFRRRIMIPVRDGRGRVIAFAGRLFDPHGTSPAPKYLNSPDTPLFDKGRTLFNLDKAQAAVRAGGGAPARLVMVEGPLDVLAMARMGHAATVAPMGTAITAHQLRAAWALHHTPLLLMDGDAAGQKAAMRAARLALATIDTPGQSLKLACLPDGADPDDLERRGAHDALAAAMEAAVPLHRFIFAALEAAHLDAEDTPEARAALWAELCDLASSIAHEDCREHYQDAWRIAYVAALNGRDGVMPHAGPVRVTPAARDAGDEGEAVAVADGDVTRPGLPDVAGADLLGGDDAEHGDEPAARQLMQLLRGLMRLRAQRAEISQQIRDAMAMAKAMGYAPGAINATIRDLEADSITREEKEAIWLLYRRLAGVRGPMNEAALPALPAAARVTGTRSKRLAHADAMIEARGISVPQLLRRVRGFEW